MTLESPQWQHTKPRNGAVILLFNTEQMLNFSAFCFIFRWSEPRSWMTSNTGSTQSNGVLKLNSFFRSLTEADYETISILALQCLGRRILLFHSVDGRSFLQQLLMGDFFWNGLKGTIQKSTLFHLLLKTEEISGTWISTHRKVWCLLTAFSCSISLEMQLLIHSLCLRLQLLLSSPPLFLQHNLH